MRPEERSGNDGEFIAAGEAKNREVSYSEARHQGSCSRLLSADGSKDGNPGAMFRFAEKETVTWWSHSLIETHLNSQPLSNLSRQAHDLGCMVVTQVAYGRRSHSTERQGNEGSRSCQISLRMSMQMDVYSLQAPCGCEASG
nr:hypothetical protein CFP56_09874 [Quercus suber]